MDPADYAREIERYLCQKNGGHLVRIVGPAFEQVCGWARQGVPLKVAFRGIDSCCERYYAKGPKRRPVRIEFCEADILDGFDAWRRAVGVGSAAEPASEAPADDATPRRPALAAHVERAIARLVNVRERGAHGVAFCQALDQFVRDLEALQDDARKARGERRVVLIDRLEALDRALRDVAPGGLDDDTLARLRREAEEELAPFGARIPPDARATAVAAAFDRLVRESLGLPTLRYD